MITYTREFVTPEIAAEYLLLNKRNRGESNVNVQRLARQMKEGKYHETHQGIAFREDGTLADGQTRLKAIVISSVSVWLWVARGLSSDAMLVLDQGRQRSIAQNLALGGFELENGNEAIPTLRLLHFGLRSVRSQYFGWMTTDDSITLLERHADALEFAFEAIPKSKTYMSTSLIRGIIGRAYYSQDREALKLFGKMLVTGDVDHGDGRPTRSVTLLREVVLARGQSSKPARVEIYKKTCRAIQAFVGREPISYLRLSQSDEEMFDLPIL